MAQARYSSSHEDKDKKLNLHWKWKNLFNFWM